MKHFIRTLVGIVPIIFTVAQFSLVAQAEDNFPSRPIKLVVPYPPGASTDTIGRAFAQELAKELKSSVIVENRPGGGTTIGAMAVKNAPDDGYTLLFQTENIYDGRLAMTNPGYKPEDFEIITGLTQTHYTLAVTSAIKATTLEEFKAYAVSREHLNIGVLGIGTNAFTILSGNLGSVLKVKTNLIPYKGGAEAMTALMAGDIDAYWATVSLASLAKQNERIKIIAVTTEHGPDRFLPEVPSFADKSFTGMAYKTLYGIAIRPTTPTSVKTKLKNAALKITASSMLRRSMELASVEPYSGTLADYVVEVDTRIKFLNAAAATAAKK